MTAYLPEQYELADDSAEAIFELLDSPRQRRLRHVALVGRLGEVQRFTHG